MKIEHIEFKNFASYGNNIQHIEFADDPAELILTLGKNGYGKTSIANAIIFALYGKVEGVKLGDLPNRINGDLLVRIKLLCGTTCVEIERGLSPSRFIVKLNGIEFDKAGKRSVQEYLEEEIYGIPYHVFKNIIILSVNDFKSFLTMSIHDKKKIIDKMFGFSILNDMHLALKNERKIIKAEINMFDAELSQINENVMSVNLKLNELLSKSDKKAKEKIESLKNTLVELSAQYDKLSSVSVLIKNKVTASDNKLTIAQKESNQLSFQLRDLNIQSKLYDKNICPMCESTLTTSFHKDRSKMIESKILKYPNKISEVKTRMRDISNNIKVLQEKRDAVNVKIYAVTSNISAFKHEIISLKKSCSKDDFKHLNQIIKDFEHNSEVKSIERDKLNSDFVFLDMIDEVLGEDGIKNMAIKNIVPVLNINIAAMITTMHLQFQVMFDEKFNCIVHHMGEEINPMTLSTGERKKADFVIIIALIKLLKMRFPQLNLLFLDELLSSIDADGIHNIIKILSQTIKDNKLNTFVINHAPLPRELFDKTIQIYRENGFSKLCIEVIE